MYIQLAEGAVIFVSIAVEFSGVPEIIEEF